MKDSHLFAMLALACSLLGAGITILLMKPERPIHPCEYQMIVTDDSVTVYDVNRMVGTIKLEGQVDSLINLDNQ